MAGYWPSSFFVFLWTKMRPISSHLDRASLVNKGFIIWHKEHWKNDLHTCLFSSTEKETRFMQKYGVFQFSCFLVPCQQRNHRKSFYCYGKYFAKENFCAPAWASVKCYCGKRKWQSQVASIVPSSPLAEPAI